MIVVTQYSSPLGSITLAAKDDALIGAWFEGQRHFLRGIGEDVVPGDGVGALRGAKDWLDRYFGGGRPEISALPLAPGGSAFQRNVWEILCGIPYGETTTYGAIARRIATENGLARMAARAVGGAVGRNPIAIIIPCHRVVGANGSLTGYAGGVEKKSWLLAHEGLQMAPLPIPTLLSGD